MYFLDKKATTKRWSLVNFKDLNRILKSKIFFHSDGQLRAAHVILRFKPISSHFYSLKHIIKAKDACLARIDMAVAGFIQKPPPVGTHYVELFAHQVAQLIAEGEEPIPSEDEAEV